MVLHAHTPGVDGNWHALGDHLAGTAKLAERFGAPFGAADLARAVAWLHDVGKCSCTFQAYLQMCSTDGDGKAKATFSARDHKMAGSLLAEALDPRLGPLLATTIIGHHGGIPDFTDARRRLEEAKSDQSVIEALSRADELELPDFSHVTRPGWLDEPVKESASLRDTEMYLRFVFSALVDADWLDTESHFDPAAASSRNEVRDLQGLFERFEQRRLTRFATSGNSGLNQVRREIYEEVGRRAELPPGLYQLATPTGSGKTLIGLGWALRHAAANGLRRIVTAVPYISVTDQVAGVYRQLLDTEDDHVVLEHHSQVIDGSYRQRLAAENWGAPVVVTTTVRMFEALFSNRPSDCRRLHRLSRSVIILDEVQALPLEVLDPIVDALRTLVSRLGASVLLMTATQPTLEYVPSSCGVRPIELLSAPERFTSHFERTERSMLGSISHEEVGGMVDEHERCLCIVNTIADAERITHALTHPDSIHLTTRLRPADRRDRLEEIRSRLDENHPCRVVSTQLVEAGVDLDFPVVLRAFAPLPSLLQADGRCNRNGLLAEKGRTFVFDLIEGKAPGGSYYAVGRPQTAVLFSDGEVDPWSDEGIERWYQLLLGDPLTVLDKNAVQAARDRLAYREVSQLFQMIDEDTTSVVVPWPSGDPRYHSISSVLESMRLGFPPDRTGIRRIQDASVSLRTRQVERCADIGLAVRVGDSDLYEWFGTYDEQLGVVLEPGTQTGIIL